MLSIAATVLSLVVMVALLLTSVDRILNSPCGASCGFALDKAGSSNPLDMGLAKLSGYFPLDFIVFTVLVCYMFLSTLHGLVMIGVRICCVELYSIAPKRTMPHGILMGSWMVMFVVLTFNFQTLTLAPQYTTFGNQFFLNTSAPGAVKQDCTLSDAAYASNSSAIPGNPCMMTQISRIINTVNVQTPFVGVTLFFSNLVFVGFFLLFVVYALFRGKSKGGERDFLSDGNNYDDNF